MNKLALSVLAGALLATGSAVAQMSPQTPPNPTPPQSLQSTPAPLVNKSTPPTRQSQAGSMTTDDGTPIKINPASKRARAK